MVRKQLLKRASYIGVALVLMLAAVPIVPSRKVFAEEGDCIDKGYKLQNWVADASLGTEATICSGVGEDFKASLTINRDLTIDLNGQTLLTNVVVNAGKIVTFKNGKKLKEIAGAIPLERILLETDCPYLTPVPNRGKRNDSSNLRFVLKLV